MSIGPGWLLLLFASVRVMTVETGMGNPSASLGPLEEDDELESERLGSG